MKSCFYYPRRRWLVSLLLVLAHGYRSMVIVVAVEDIRLSRSDEREDDQNINPRIIRREADNDDDDLPCPLTRSSSSSVEIRSPPDQTLPSLTQCWKHSLLQISSILIGRGGSRSSPPPRSSSEGYQNDPPNWPQSNTFSKMQQDWRHRHPYLLSSPTFRDRIGQVVEDPPVSHHLKEQQQRRPLDLLQPTSSLQASHAFAGMTLQVFQTTTKEIENAETPTDSIFHDNKSPPEQGLSANGATDTHTASTAFHLTSAYRVEEAIHLNLGIPPKHYLDFAYTPVYYYPNSHQDTGSDVSSHFNWNTNIEDGIRSSKPSHPSKNCVAPIQEEEDTCLALREGTNVISRPEMAISTTGGTDLEPERANDFNAWWKWWFSYQNPWWRSSRTDSSDSGDRNQGSDKQSEYTTDRTAFAGGSHGEVWRGRRICAETQKSDCDEEIPLILKRLKVEHGYRLLEAGLREIYFGQWIRDLVVEAERDLFTTYVDHFFRELPSSFGTTDFELWIVFEDAGPSLRSFLYSPITSSSGFVMFQHSPLWAQLRMSAASSKRGFATTKQNEEVDLYHGLAAAARRKKNSQKENHKIMISNAGRQILRTILRQILSAASILHEAGIVHRDIKPSNVMCTTDVSLEGLDLFALEEMPNIQCRLGDFSSGWNAHTNKHLYTKGPSPAEQTDEYAPPESFIDPNWVPFDERRPESYDSWSIGVLALELLLGTPNVFSVDQRTTVLLTAKMKKEGASEEDVQRALYLAALSQFCIYTPNANSDRQQGTWPYRDGDPLHKTALAQESCTLHDFHRALRARDPLGVGFDSSTDLLLHLIWQLLAWDPVKRITAAEALQHPFFHIEDGSLEEDEMFPGRHNALESQMLDPRLDFSIDDSVDEFLCPKCGRRFVDWYSCHKHATTRKHAKFCSYDRTHLPTCINTHAMLPAHPTSGYCDLQGRRRTIEDFHSIYLHPDVQFYGIFDGHTGNFASKFAASTLFHRLVKHLPTLKPVLLEEKREEWKLQVEHNVSQAYEETHEDFLKTLALAPTMDQSGTTATALLVTENAIVLSSLGDSRAVMCSRDAQGQPVAIQLTKDHVASDPVERALVLERGGIVVPSKKEGGVDRVNGTLAISRSIGDAALASMLSRAPQVTTWTRDEIQKLCGTSRSGDPDQTPESVGPCFMILASDGLWDVISNQEAMDRVSEVVAHYDSTDRISWDNGGAFQEAAEVLAVDALVRGSTDNIGVCVVAIA